MISASAILCVGLRFGTRLSAVGVVKMKLYWVAAVLRPARQVDRERVRSRRKVVNRFSLGVRVRYSSHHLVLLPPQSGW